MGMFITMEEAGQFDHLLLRSYHPHIKQYTPLEGNELIDRMLKRAMRTMLDIGCGVGWGMLAAQHRLGIPDVEGVERSSLKDVLGDYERMWNCSTQEEMWADMRKRLGEPIPGITNYSTPPVVTYGTSVADFKPGRDRYDLIVVSNVVHYWSEATFNAARRLMEEHSDKNTGFYIRVRPDTKPEEAETNRMSAKRMLALCEDFRKAHGLKRYINDGWESPEYTFSNL